MVGFLVHFGVFGTCWGVFWYSWGGGGWNISGGGGLGGFFGTIRRFFMVQFRGFYGLIRGFWYILRQNRWLFGNKCGFFCTHQNAMAGLKRYSMSHRWLYVSHTISRTESAPPVASQNKRCNGKLASSCRVAAGNQPTFWRSHWYGKRALVDSTLGILT